MTDNRRQFSNNEKMLLYNEVNGRCPLCGDKLTYTKNGKPQKSFEIAHIYPVNPLFNEERLLESEDRLSEDVNSLDNVLAVCRKCHKKFDNPRTVEEYRTWVRIKRNLLRDGNVKDNYSLYNIEDEIKTILMKLNNQASEEELVSLSYQLLKIEEKTNDTLPYVIKRTIKNDVVDYFNYIHNLFVDINKTNPYKFETLASQIKTFYLKTMQIDSNQEFVYNSLVDWLNEKTQSYSKRACEIVIAYFVQDCEVFS